MIETFEGRIGGGKTYSAMERMFYQWMRGGAVYTNVAVNWKNCQEYIAKRYGIELDPRQFTHIENKQICEFAKHTPIGTFDLPVLVVIDEAHLWLMSSTEKRGPEVKALLEFLSQSRKDYTDVIFITQSLKNIDCKIARLCQYVWRFRDMQKWKIPALRMAFPFPYILQICYDYDGKTEMDRRWCLRDKAVFRTYDSHAKHSVIARLEGAVTKFTLKKTDRQLPDWPVYTAAALALLALLSI